MKRWMKQRLSRTWRFWFYPICSLTGQPATASWIMLECMMFLFCVQDNTWFKHSKKGLHIWVNSLVLQIPQGRHERARADAAQRVGLHRSWGTLGLGTPNILFMGGKQICLPLPWRRQLLYWSVCSLLLKCVRRY